MNKEQIKVAQMAVKAQTFATAKAGTDFTHVPPTAVDLKHAATLTKLSTGIVNLGGKEVIQQGGGFGMSTGEKRVSRQDLEEMATATNRTAAAIAEEQQTPAMMAQFRMPHGHGDEGLKTSILGMAGAITSLGLDSEFAAHALPGQAAALEAAAGNFVADAGAQGGALGEQVGATTSIPTHIRTVKSAVKTLNAIYQNVYASQPDTLGSWQSQSHVEKVGVRHKATPADAPAPAPVVPQ